jgi:hypothetical protein
MPSWLTVISGVDKEDGERGEGESDEGRDTLVNGWNA